MQDGTLQATALGLIALLRERGTIGGYARVANVIDCDVDRLAQLRPGNRVRFREVTPSEARTANGAQAAALSGLVGRGVWKSLRV